MDEGFPLLFFGVASLVMATVAFSTNTHLGTARYPLWVLFLGLGAIASAGGIAAVFAEEDDDRISEALADGSMIAVDRREWDELTRAVGRSRASPSPVHPLAGLDLGSSTLAPGEPQFTLSTSDLPRRSLTEPATPRATDPTGGPSPGESAPEWLELESDIEVPDPLLGAEPGAAPTIPEDVEAMLAELERSTSTGGLELPLPDRATAAQRQSEGRATAPRSIDAAELDFETALRRMERSLPPGPPDPSDTWLDPARLPQEFARLLNDLYPPDHEPARRPQPAPSTVRPSADRCVNCGGRRTSSTGECAQCHGGLCQTCEGLASLTGGPALCDQCATAPPDAGGGPAARRPPG